MLSQRGLPTGQSKPRFNQRSNNMASSSDIEWTDSTWNPIAGCKMVSPGCTNCYAQRMAGRLQAMGLEKYHGTTRKSGKKSVWTGKINVDPNTIQAPLS